MVGREICKVLYCSVHHPFSSKRNTDGLYGFLLVPTLSRLHPLIHEIAVPFHVSPAAPVQTVRLITQEYGLGRRPELGSLSQTCNLAYA